MHPLCGPKFTPPAVPNSPTWLASSGSLHGRPPTSAAAWPYEARPLRLWPCTVSSVPPRAGPWKGWMVSTSGSVMPWTVDSHATGADSGGFRRIRADPGGFGGVNGAVSTTCKAGRGGLTY
eukprot:2472178-Pyramimonas_sp.AAC.2